MKILSLFDGMACGMIAFLGCDIRIEKYVAYEIDKYAVQTSSSNFPIIEHKGDVFQADFTDFQDFDFLVGGSPCTYWSIAKNKHTRETTASGLGWELFSQFVRALHQAKPKYFIYENNKSMSKAIRESITETFGFEPICINSALVSAQNRQRLYWVGIRRKDGTYRKAKINQPEDRGILLRDVINTGSALFDKAYTIASSYYKGAGQDIPRQLGGKSQTGDRAMVAEPIKILTEKEMDYMVRDHQDQRWQFCNKPGQDEKAKCVVANIRKGVPYNVVAEPVCAAQRGRYDEDGKINQHFEANDNQKTNALTTVDKDNMIAEPSRSEAKNIYKVRNGMITVKDKEYPIKLADGNYIIRKLTVQECMKLQTVPSWYKFPVSNSQAYKMLGNGWTIEVIKHLIQSALNDNSDDVIEEQMNIFQYVDFLTERGEY